MNQFCYIEKCFCCFCFLFCFSFLAGRLLIMGRVLVILLVICIIVSSQLHERFVLYFIVRKQLKAEGKVFLETATKAGGK